jgi:hypothetical protein
MVSSGSYTHTHTYIIFKKLDLHDRGKGFEFMEYILIIKYIIKF